MTCTSKARLSALLLLAMAVMAGAQAAEQKYPDVVDVTVRVAGENRFDFDVTLSSPYDTPQRDHPGP